MKLKDSHTIHTTLKIVLTSKSEKSLNGSVCIPKEKNPLKSSLEEYGNTIPVRVSCTDATGSLA